jgi:hypothetical protein
MPPPSAGVFFAVRLDTEKFMPYTCSITRDKGEVMKMDKYGDDVLEDYDVYRDDVACGVREAL